MAGIWFYVVPQLESSLRKQKRDDLARVARVSVAPLAAIANSNVDHGQLDELVRAVADNSDARVTLYGLQRSRRAVSALWIVSDSGTQNNVSESELLALRAARLDRSEKGYGKVNGQTMAQTAVPVVYRGQI